MRLSVLLPCRDAHQHLDAALASLAAQTYASFEVLAVDDGSTDDTAARLQTWAARDARIRVIRTPARGLVPALNAALEHARGEIIARMDADDVAQPQRFELQLALLDRQPAIAACGTAVRYFPAAQVRAGARRYEQWINSLLTHEQIVRDIFVECPLPHPTLMIRRGALEAVGGYHDPGWPEDYDLVLRLWAGGHGLAKLPQALLHWREREQRLSRTDARYGEAAFRRCKASWLARTLLPGFAGVVVWGAGPVGKSFARALMALDVRVRAFVELDRRKIGQHIHGALVIAPDAINEYRGAFAVAAVGSARARADIRASLRAAGWQEMKDFCAVA